MNEINAYVALPTEPDSKSRFHSSVRLEIAIKNRQRMKRQVWSRARKKGLLSSAKPVSLV